jgi:hypothetical protein
MLTVAGGMYYFFRSDGVEVHPGIAFTLDRIPHMAGAVVGVEDIFPSFRRPTGSVPAPSFGEVPGQFLIRLPNVVIAVRIVIVLG